MCLCIKNKFAPSCIKAQILQVDGVEIAEHFVKFGITVKLLIPVSHQHIEIVPAALRLKMKSPINSNPCPSTHIFLCDVDRRWKRSGRIVDLMSKAQMVRQGLQHIHGQSDAFFFLLRVFVLVIAEHGVERCGNSPLENFQS